MKKIKRLKYTLVGSIAALLVITMIIPVLADTVEAVFNSVNISINGQKAASVGESFTLDNGTTVPYSIAYNGTTYLPLRKIGELFDKEIYWDNATKTASLQDKPVPVAFVPPAVPKEDITPANRYGNSSSNAINGGTATIQGNWLYYLSYSDKKNSIKRIKKDGTGGETLLESGNVQASDLNVVGEWIYYFMYHDGIYKIRIDGYENTKIMDVKKIDNMIVAGGYIYYISEYDYSHYGSVFRIDTEGKTIFRMTDGFSKNMNLSDEWIYYLYQSEDNKKCEIRRINYEGTRIEILLSDSSFKELIINGDYMYYTDANGNIFKSNTEDTYETEKLGVRGSLINISDGWIYYYNTAFTEIMKAKTDGTGAAVFQKGSYTNINIAGDWVYFVLNKNGKVCRIRTNAKDLQEDI